MVKFYGEKKVFEHEPSNTYIYIQLILLITSAMIAAKHSRNSNTILLISVLYFLYGYNGYVYNICNHIYSIKQILASSIVLQNFFWLFHLFIITYLLNRLSILIFRNEFFLSSSTNFLVKNINSSLQLLFFFILPITANLQWIKKITYLTKNNVNTSGIINPPQSFGSFHLIATEPTIYLDQSDNIWLFNDRFNRWEIKKKFRGETIMEIAKDGEILWQPKDP